MCEMSEKGNVYGNSYKCHPVSLAANSTRTNEEFQISENVLGRLNHGIGNTQVPAVYSLSLFSHYLIMRRYTHSTEYVQISLNWLCLYTVLHAPFTRSNIELNDPYACMRACVRVYLIQLFKLTKKALVQSEYIRIHSRNAKCNWTPFQRTTMM